ncbi:MAG: insulinase family protein [Myxococcales bacterium FL481]|nr:MAG: insulinase family protein [Myxococcales bacterium FL481]
MRFQSQPRATAWFRPLGALALCALTACAGVLRSDSAPVPEHSYRLRQMTYPSGLKVLVEHDVDRPQVTVAMVVRAGSAQDPEDKAGLAHLLEHLVFRARYGRNDRAEPTVSRRLEHAGADHNAATGLDTTTYWSIAGADALPELLFLSAARLANPVSGISKRELDVERNVVVNELRQRNDTHGVGAALAAMQGVLFPQDHAYARSIGGTVESLQRIELEDLERFGRRYYAPSNVTLVISGNVELERAHEWVEDAFSHEQLNAKSPAPAPSSTKKMPARPREGDEITTIEAHVARPELWVGWVLPPDSKDDPYTPGVVSGQVNRQIRSAIAGHADRFVSADCGLSRGRQASMLLCVVSLRPGTDPERAASKVLDEVYRIWEFDSPKQAAAKNSQNRLAATVDAALQSEDPLWRSVDRARTLAAFGDAQMSNNRTTAISQMDQAKVSSFAAEYVSRKKARFVHVMPVSGELGAEPTVERGLVAADSSVVDPPRSAEDIKSLELAALNPSVRRVKLDNGALALLVPRPGPPLVSVGLLFRGGPSYFGPLGAGLLGDTLSYRQDWNEGSVVKDHGGRVHGLSGLDHSALVASGLSAHLEKFIAIAVQTAKSQGFDKQSLLRFRRVVVPILAKNEDQAYNVARRKLSATLYGDHVYGRRLSVEQWSEASFEDAQAWLSNTIHPGNAVLVVAGTIDVEEAERMVRRHLGAWTGSKATVDRERGSAPIPKLEKPVVHKVVLPGASQARLDLACRLPTVRREPANDLLHAALSLAINARLREEMGATYGIHGRAERLRGGSAALHLTTQIGNGDLTEALFQTRELWDNFADRLNGDLLERARWRVASRHANAIRSNQSLVQELLRRKNLGGGVTGYDRYLTRLAEVSAEDLLEAFAVCQRSTVLSLVGEPEVIDLGVAEGWEAILLEDSVGEPMVAEEE